MTLRDVVGWLVGGFRKKGAVHLGLFLLGPPVSVTRISFNEDYWNNSLLPKLTSFYDNCVAPEIVSPVHVLGIPMRDLSK